MEKNKIKGLMKIIFPSIEWETHIKKEDLPFSLPKIKSSSDIVEERYVRNCIYIEKGKEERYIVNRYRRIEKPDIDLDLTFEEIYNKDGELLEEPVIVSHHAIHKKPSTDREYIGKWWY